MKNRLGNFIFGQSRRDLSSPTGVVLVGLGICRQTPAPKKGARFPQGSIEIGDVKVYPTPGTVVIYCGLLASGSTFWRR